MGTKEVKKIEINKENSLDSDDIEMLEDMLVVAINEANINDLLSRAWVYGAYVAANT